VRTVLWMVAWVSGVGATACSSGDGSKREGGEDSAEPADSADVTDSAAQDSADPAPLACALDDAALDAALAELVATVERALVRNGVDGASVAIGCGEQVRAAGVGLRGPDGEAVDSATRFQAASITKNFTAAVALSMADDGLLSLDAPVSDAVPYVNDRSPYDAPITLHDLMTHAAGYPTSFGGRSPSMDLEVYFEHLGHAELWAPAGAVYVYSNLGASLVGLAAQEVSGTPFADLTATRVFEPAGMARASLHAEDIRADGNFATGSSSYGNIGPEWGYLPTGYYGPMGGAWLTASDLVAWGQVHLRSDGSVLSADAFDAMHHPWIETREGVGEHQGYHLFLEDFGGTPMWGHGGSAPGFQGQFVILPEHSLVVAVLVNGETLYVPRVVDDFLTLLLDRTPTDPGDTVRPVADWGRYAGRYTDLHGGLGEVDVEVDGTRAVASASGPGCSGELIPWIEDGFYLVCGTTYYGLTFWPDDAGTGTAYVSSLYGVAAGL